LAVVSTGATPRVPATSILEAGPRGRCGRWMWPMNVLEVTLGEFSWLVRPGAQAGNQVAASVR